MSIVDIEVHHKFESQVEDDPLHPEWVRPSNWNDGHDIVIREFDYIDFNTEYVDGVQEGRLQWNLEDGTLEVGLPGGSVVLQIGQEVLLKCTNKEGAAISNGTAVYISGASGANPEIKIASNDSLTTARVVGVTTEDIAKNQKGYVTLSGLVRDIDLDGFTEGAILWLGIDGGYTTTQPLHPIPQIAVGVCLRSHAEEGVMYCAPYIIPYVLNGLYLGDLSGGNYSKFENDGTLEFNGDAKVWDDLQVDISNVFIPVANAPTERLYNHGIVGGVTFPVLGFALNNYIYFDMQTSHSMLLNSILSQHIHFMTPTDGSGTPDRFQFRLDVIAAGATGNWSVPTGSPFTSEHIIGGDYTNTSEIMEIGEIPGVNTTVSTIYKCKLTRIAATQDEYAGEVYVQFTDGHYQRDTVGSRQEYIK